MGGDVYTFALMVSLKALDRRLSGVALNETGGAKPQVLVHVSTFQSSILVLVF